MVRASRSRSPREGKQPCQPESERAHDDIVQAARSGLEALCAERRIPESHGPPHAERVLAHLERALREASSPVAPARALAARLAALLHDVDDRKYFGPVKAGQYPNARRLMEEAGPAAAVVEEALRMIDFVSCSKNGNSVPEEAKAEPEWLWPRWADRLEATGEIGVVRCWQYNAETPTPLACAATPRPTSEEEVWALATEERFAEYQRSGGHSNSMMDHYYDKLLRVARPDYQSVRNTYLEAEMDKRAAPLVNVCLAFGRTGKVPEDMIREMAARLQCAEA